MRDAIAKSGLMCLVRTAGSPGMSMLQMCNDGTRQPSGKLITSGFVARRFVDNVHTIHNED